jgi:hypothetical protein
MTGKRTAWLELPRHLRADPELTKAVRTIAESNSRSISTQIMLWIVEAVQKERVVERGISWGPKLVKKKEEPA